MDKRREFEMPIEQRTLLNAGHGPPIPPLSSVPLGIYNSPISSSSTSLFHRNATHGVSGSCGITSPGFYGDGRYRQMFLNRPEIADASAVLQNIKEGDQQLQMLRNELHLMQTGGGQKLIGDLVRDNDELQRQLNAKINELESLRMKYERIMRELTSMPDVTVRLPLTKAPDDFINLVASEEGGACGYNVPNKEFMKLDDCISMTKSVQCSEPSMEQVVDVKGETKEMEIASPPIIPKKGRGISTSSSSSSESFEVVGQGSCLGSPAEREDVEMSSMNLKAQIKVLQSEVSELSRKLEAVEEERRRETAELKERLDQISHWQEKVNFKASAVTPADRQSEHQSQNDLSELRSANWKLTEQNLELTRENEDLRKKELDLRAAVLNVNLLQEELDTKRQLIQELEARIRDMEHIRLAESYEQKGMALGSASELATENTLLKHQIEAYKEDFEGERKDRENLIAQKDTLQRCYDILRMDLDVARQQLKKYESEITMLRADNSTMRTKLRTVTEEVDALRELRQSTTLTQKAVAPPPAQNRPLMPQPVLHNILAPQKPSPTPSGPPSGDWECQACTFKNPAPRMFCEMCGTHEPLRGSSAAQVPNCAYVPNIPPSRELPPVQWNMAQTTTPLLSNLRNYGDIETD